MIATSKIALPPLQAPATKTTSSSTSTIKPATSQTSRHPPLSDATRWHHLTTRTPSTTPFVYAVLTTKIYCLPTCPSRLARRANITFYRNPTEAENEGFRACKRCKPSLSPAFMPVKAATPDTTANDGSAETALTTPYDPTDPSLKLHHALTLIHRYAQTGEKISLAQLASEVGLSKWHLQRAFKRRVGRSPKEIGEELLEKQRRESEALRPSDTKEASSSTANAESDATVNQSHLQQLPSFNMEDFSQGHFPCGLPMDFNFWNNQEIDWKLGDATPTGSSAPAFSTSNHLTESSSSYATTPAPLSDSFSPVIDTEMLFPPPEGEFDFNSSFCPGGFGPDVEGVLRDLFPEIYDGSQTENVDLMT